MAYIMRLSVLLSAILMFFPGINPARINAYINKTMSLFTSAVSYSKLVEESIRAIKKGWIAESAFHMINLSSIVICIGIALAIAAACFSMGNLKFKNLSNVLALVGSLFELSGLAGIYFIYKSISNTEYLDRILPEYPFGNYLFFALALIVFIVAIIQLKTSEKAPKEMKYEMQPKYQLFLMYLPFAALIFIFSYLPLWGWRYAFFNYHPGESLTLDNFVGFHWFEMLIRNEATRSDMIRVLRNTLAMSGLGIITSWVPMMFAVLLAEATSRRFKRFVQVFTTIPNFISWVLVYALALAIFSTDGFVNGLMMKFSWYTEAKNFLMGDSYIWLKMLAWGMWKGLGWSAIIYIAAISSIDPQMYEAATVDGAGRFQKMRYITIPSLMPTYFVLLVMSIAAILSNGMDQYLVFENPTNTSVIEVLDLYVYHLGIEDNIIPLSTVIGMLKSVISVVLLFSVNKLSKVFRGESIV